MTLSGQTCLVTGASSGLGLAVSKRLAQQGAKVVMLCRSQEKGQQAVSEVKEAAPKATVDLMLCDFASMESVRSSVTAFKNKYPTLDLLFNNAAAMKKKRSITEDGFETMFQVNYLAPFVISTALLPELRNSPNGLIVNNGVPSEKYRIALDDLQCQKKYAQYGSFFHAKLCQLMSTLELARRPESEGVCVLVQNPGTFKSDLVREVPWPAGWFKNVISGSVDDAADNVVYLATSPEAPRGTGKVFWEREEKPPTEYWKDTATRERLWSVTESLLAQGEEGERLGLGDDVAKQDVKQSVN